MFKGPITSGEEYIKSLQGRKLKVYLFGEIIENIVDHPVIRPSINAMAKTFDLANSDENLATVYSSLSNQKINRFLHIAEKSEDLVFQNKMQRRLGQLTGTCFQRCVGMDAINALHSVTYEIDEKYHTKYHQKFLKFVEMAQKSNFVLGGAMTDVKGDRSKRPFEQDDSDMFVHVIKRDGKGVYISGAKAHQTGALNSHWLIVMPTMRMTEQDKDYTIVGAIPVDTPGVTYIYGRQSNDLRHLEGFPIDTGNHFFSGQEALVIFENVFIPTDLIFMNGEYEFATMLVDRFTNYHRRSYVCKSGVSDVLIGAAATIADYNGVSNASHIRDKLVEMTHLNETIYATGIASSYQSYKMKSGVWMNDDMLANVCKQNVTRFPYELGRLAQDLAGGLMVTLPSEKDLKHDELGPLLDKYLKGKNEISTEDRVRILRLIENMTLGRNAVGYLTESMHGAGSPQAQRINIYRLMQIEFKKNLAKYLAGIDISEKELSRFENFYERVFS
ncbi:MAG: 4-hydroxybutyryl-CoA dehydratase/vinylacetyl-CoA-Delta-isomerase [Candidatus Heimdallarchaeota archaeon LC_3]|nr:MAG: 4-hydroxybutyryl-CoA dehydratase/vinylacetyl-CoA-Delta-isomerase [Candidatus Heimdallarchaeota archaeon LC_3]